MKVKVLGITLLTSLALVACGGGDDESGMGEKGNNNQAQDVGYENRDNGMMRNGDNRDLETNEMNNYQNGANENQMNMDNNDNNRYDVARELADDVAEQVKEVKRAYVLKGEENAYVAVVKNGDAQDELNDDIKKKISDIVKKEDKEINNVYVSSNPDFFGMTENYADKVRNDEPIRGFFDEFGQMIDRIFPEAN
ncbi:hypothetical protein N781_06645 [Pontibacillus halophilus JSM 076056 = DSM 19796]|uniref:YhcN/YlaJ family sporulation lipoprotein n=1 Tax=Pontibacillus halophilus JSM 076056 = DSM 19796 TaxID=1385510 RepID=A0A0A5GFE4_9BACI|nr:YhcN/YlaJ family sporulation lipoprotein [Pontibacillus halophilus]KGX90729.1 hypothetical protein N781_06645 [Pontibacillus halophilus JSM 076056 = DSM 19796]